MSSPAQQITITVTASVLTAAIIGYGTANYAAGSVQAQVNTNTQELRDRKPLVDAASSYEVRLTAAEARIDAFQSLVIDGQKEQRNISNKILEEVAYMRKDTAVNSTKIGAIEIDISEIKESIR